jgi:hypothetical protein
MFGMKIVSKASAVEPYKDLAKEVKVSRTTITAE